MGRIKRRDRHKPCSLCDTENDVLFRVQSDPSGSWQFVCDSCLNAVKSDNPHYVYGGTWKAQKR